MQSLPLASFMYHNSFEVHPCMKCTSTQLVPVHCWLVFHGMVVPHWFIHSPVDGHLDCFQCLAIMKNATVNIHTQAFIQTCVFISLGQIPRSRIAESYGICTFSFLINWRLLFKVVVRFPSAPAVGESPIPSTHPQLLVRSVFLITAILLDVW